MQEEMEKERRKKEEEERALKEAEKVNFCGVDSTLKSLC